MARLRRSPARRPGNSSDGCRWIRALEPLPVIATWSVSCSTPQIRVRAVIGTEIVFPFGPMTPSELSEIRVAVVVGARDLGGEAGLGGAPARARVEQRVHLRVIAALPGGHVPADGLALGAIGLGGVDRPGGERQRRQNARSARPLTSSRRRRAWRRSGVGRLRHEQPAVGHPTGER